MPDLSRDDVLKLAKLARLALSDDEVAEFSAELTAILHYVEQLQAVDVSDLAPTAQVTGLTNVMRPDEARSYGYEPSELLKLAPATEDRQIKVKKVL